MSELLPITAIVVSCNEAMRLERCLRSISFCSEIIVCDLFSSDGSAEIGENLATKFLQKPRVDIVEYLWSDLFALASNDWILRIDPDEEVPPELITGIRDNLAKSQTCCYIALPKLYFFLCEPLYFSIWGGVRYFPQLVNRLHIDFHDVVHSGISYNLDKGFAEIHGYDNFPLQHYWVDDIPQMIEKHIRYIRNEGSGRLRRGEQFSIKRMFFDCIESFKKNFILGKCLSSGWQGLYLGGFHLLYTFATHVSLLLASWRAKKNAGKIV